LIGHSYGAIVSLGALSLTDRVHRLVLYEPPLIAARLHDCEQWATQIDAHIQARDRAAAAVTLLQRAAIAEEIGELRAFPPAWNQIERDVHTVPREIRSLTSMPCTRFDDITLPVLLLFGARSENYLRASVKHLASVLPAARTAAIADQLPQAHTFALAGGGAVIVHGFVTRPKRRKPLYRGQRSQSRPSRRSTAPALEDPSWLN
jgi:pimeloyl-ACP methyl ester carboxylesterase